MAYFPPLDKCLTGKEPLISWNAVLNELTSDPDASDQIELQSFLSSNEAVELLIRSLQPFSGRNEQSKSAYENRTTPIHIASASLGTYDLDQLKSDALWLSKELDINEVQALRIVIVEWQSRPADLLLGRTVVETPRNGCDKNENGLSDVTRHRRLLQIYLQESSAIKHICALLVALDETQPSSTPGTDLWMLRVGARIRNAQSNKGTGSGKDYVLGHIKDFQRQITLLEGSQNWPGCFQSDFALHADFSTAVLRDMASNLRQSLTYHFHAAGISSAETILAWFQLMQKTNFLQDLAPPTEDQATLVDLLQCLISVFSAALLALPEAMSEIDQINDQKDGGIAYPNLDGKPYITEDACVKDVTLILFEAAEAGTIIAAPAVYAWSIIIMYIRDLARLEQEAAQHLEDGNDRHGSTTRRRSAIEQKYEASQHRDLGIARDDPPQYLARQAADNMNVFAIVAELSRILSTTYSIVLELPIAQTCRTILFDIIRQSLPTVAYDEHIVESVLALLLPDSTMQSHPQRTPGLASRFWKDRTRSYPLLYQQALARWPYELSPLLRLLSALSGNLTQADEDWVSVVETFEHLTSMTMTLPEGFRGYTLEHEEDGVNAFRLHEDLPFFVDNITTSSFHMEGVVAEHLRLPAGTQGTILRDSRPFIVSLKHDYSGLPYIGLLLSSLLPVARYTLSPPAPSTDNFVAADIINLVVNLLRGAKDIDKAKYVLEELSKWIHGEPDLTTIIGELLEVELLARLEQSSKPGATDLLVQCLRFFQAVGKWFPEQLWSYLARGTLLGASNGSSAILATNGSADDEGKQLRLISECMELYKAAVDDALHGLIKRRSTPKASRGSRFDSPMESLGEISERVITQALTAYTSLALQVLQLLSQTNGFAPQDKSQAIESITSTFRQLLVCVYGIGDITTSTSGPMKVLANAAHLVITTLLPDDVSMQTIAPLLAPMSSLTTTDIRVLSAGHKTLLVKEAQSTLMLLCLLLRSAKALDRPVVKLNSTLISAMDLFTSLFALQAPFQKVVVELLIEIVYTAQSNDGAPVSIFSQLTQQQGTYFLDLLTRLDSTLTDTATEGKIWDLFAAACKYGQQWFAMYLVTGVLPKDQIKDKPKDRRTALSHALDLLSDVKNINPERAAAALRFVAEAQKTWSWATSIVRKHADFLTNALAWLKDLKPYSPANPSTAPLSAKEYQLATALCEVLAVNVHAALAIGDKKVCKDIAEKASFLTLHAVSVDGYNRSSKLTSNLAGRFGGLALADLKRTLVNPGSSIDQQVYDIDTAEAILNYDASWRGKASLQERAHATDYYQELNLANVNWSLYNAQVGLLKAWKTLAITMTDGEEVDDELIKVLVQTVRSCLTANVDTNAIDPDAAELLQIRADLVFTILSKLVKTPCDINRKDANIDKEKIAKSGLLGDFSVSQSILETAWELIRTSTVNYTVAQVSEDLTYYRTLLQVLFLAVRLDRTATDTAQSTKSTSRNGANATSLREGLYVDIMAHTILPQFRSLCANLHESTECARPEDFALLIALAKAVLVGNLSKYFFRQIADVVATSEVTRSAASLFSWSDRLAELTDDDPVYGEMAIAFLLTLSRVPQVAEEIATQNILTQISSANLSEHLRKPGGKGPFDEPARMFAIWSDGFLPLCLNLLEAVGPPIASDISSFFSSFPQQLQRAEKALQNASPSPRNPRAGAVTLGLISEARDLVIIAQILKSAIEFGAAEGIITDDVEELEYDMKIVGEDIEAMTKSQRSLRDRIMPATTREMALYNDKSGRGSDDALQAVIVKEIDQILASLKE